MPPIRSLPSPAAFRSGLRAALWIGLAAVVLVVVAVGLQVGLPIYRQQVAIREIKRLGGYMNTRERGPAWVQRLMGDERMDLLDEVVYVALDEKDVNDETLRHLSCLTGLEGLALTGTRVTDAGLAHLQKLTRLSELSICDTKVTDVGVAELKRALPGLTIVR